MLRQRHTYSLSRVVTARHHHHPNVRILNIRLPRVVPSLSKRYSRNNRLVVLVLLGHVVFHLHRLLRHVVQMHLNVRRLDRTMITVPNLPGQDRMNRDDHMMYRQEDPEVVVARENDDGRRPRRSLLTDVRPRVLHQVIHEGIAHVVVLAVVHRRLLVVAAVRRPYQVTAMAVARRRDRLP